MPDLTFRRPGERWLPAVGWEGFYEVSDQGRVWSLDRWITDTLGRKQLHGGRMMIPFPDKGSLFPAGGGHLVVTLSRNGKPHQRFVHRLVLEAFVGPCPDGMQGCHGPAGAADNSLPNLRWDTGKANQQDSVREGTHHEARKTRCESGHEFTEKNTRVDKKGNRRCRKCQAIITNARYHRTHPDAAYWGPRT